MKIIFDWDKNKNQRLIETRGVSFEEVVVIINEGLVLDILEHYNKTKYPNQKIYVIEIGGYIHLVPFIKEKEHIFLKTIIPSRKAHKKYKAKI